ncbi:hypothetical protein D9M72_647100 [compost metagenome]
MALETVLRKCVASSCTPSRMSDSSITPTSCLPLTSTGSCDTSARRMRWNAVSRVSSGPTLITRPSSKRRAIRSRRSPYCLLFSSP